MILTLISRPAARTLAATVLVWLLHVGLATPALALQSSPDAPQPERRSAPGTKPAAGGKFWNAKLRELRAERRAQRRAERWAARAERRAARAERRAASADERRTARLVKRAERGGERGAEDPGTGGESGAVGDEPAQPNDDPAAVPADPAEAPAGEPAEPAPPADQPRKAAPKPRAKAPAEAAPAPRKPARRAAPAAPVSEPAPAPVDVEPAPGEPAPFFPLPTRPVPYTGAPGTVRTIIMAAQRQIGWPYVWGGESRAEGGFDCSGLIDHAYWSAGIELPGRPTAAVLWQMSQPIAKEQLRPGDLVFVGAPSGAPHHVAMYVGDGMVVVARYTGTLITLQPLDAVAWDGFGRLLSGADLAPAADKTADRPADEAPERPGDDERDPAPADPTPTRPDAIAWLDRISRICPLPEPDPEHDGETDAPATLAELVDPDGNGLPGGAA